MAKTQFLGLPTETVIEIVALKKDNVYIIEMTYGDWLRFKKKPDFIYIPYQKNHHSFKETKK